jgi:FkbM family methyltransferase
MTAGSRMISYAQNGEDVVLRRAFCDQSVGFYVDVGAYDPVSDSVTKHFYDAGWHGINIEPVPRHFEALVAARPRDINLNVAVSDRPGVLKMTEVDVAAMSTLRPELAEMHRASGHTVAEVEVVVRTLADVLREHDVPTIDFLKVDVEGLEGKVLAGADLATFRPRVILAETNFREEWEPVVLASGYQFVLFDGVNSFYVRDEDADGLRERFDRPAVIALDLFDPYMYVAQLMSANDQILDLRAEVIKLRGEVAQLRELPKLSRVERWARQLRGTASRR